MTADATRATLEERGKRYGRFLLHAEMSQKLKATFTRCLGTHKSSTLADDQREALDMIAHKLARIFNGDPNYGDSWRDIAGYATLVADRLEGKENA